MTCLDVVQGLLRVELHPGAQLVGDPPAVRETWVPSLGRVGLGARPVRPAGRVELLSS